MSYLPWFMSAITILTMWLAGSRYRYTWLISLSNQALWLSWILMTANWGFLPMNLCMWFVSIRNHLRWRPSLLEQWQEMGRVNTDRLLAQWSEIIELKAKIKALEKQLETTP